MAARAATSEDGIWQKTDVSSRTITVPLVRPERYVAFQVDQVKLSQALAKAPLEGSPEELRSIMTLPMPDGSFARFEMFESPIMAPALAAKFLQLKTYAGKELDDPAASVRIDTGPKGFHGLILSPSGAVFIDPFTPGDKDFCIS